jgi:hypothetical protein
VPVIGIEQLQEPVFRALGNDGEVIPFGGEDQSRGRRVGLIDASRRRLRVGSQEIALGQHTPRSLEASRLQVQKVAFEKRQLKNRPYSLWPLIDRGTYATESDQADRFFTEGHGGREEMVNPPSSAEDADCAEAGP